MTVETDWKPFLTMDFFEATPQEFHNTVGRFRDWAKDQPRDMTLELPDGWHTITPPMAEELLKRNTRNRPVDWSYVLAYGTHMANNRWMETGEPVIINAYGDVDDAGHRLWACYLSGSSFRTYVVNVAANPDLFAFIDSGRSRNGSNTLHTAGFGKQSSMISRIVKDIAMPFDEGSLAYNGRLPRHPCTNADILDYVRANPEMAETIRQVREIYPAAVKRIGDTSVACFVGWKIHSMFGSAALENFYGDMVRTNLPAANPITVLQKRLDEHLAALSGRKSDAKYKMRLTPTKILALTIIAFNMYQSGQTTTRRLDPRADDAFPNFDTDTVERQEAA